MSISNVAAEKKTSALLAQPTGAVSADPGPASAPLPPNSKLASKADMVASARPPSGLGNLTALQVRALMMEIGFSETKSKYNSVDASNYCGKYQFSSQNLVDLGYIKADYLEHYGQTSNTGVVHVAGAWTGKDNITKLEDFLAAEQAQDTGIFVLLTNYYNALVKLNGIKPDDTVSTVAGMLSVAHAIGTAAAKKWRESSVGADVYGTSAGEYFKLGQYAVDVLGVPNIVR